VNSPSRVAWLVAATYAAVSVLLLGWAVWLLTTSDPDGGRHPMGATMLVVSLVLAVVAVVAFRRRSRR